MRKHSALSIGLVLAASLVAVSCAKKEANTATADGALDRTVLPIPEPAPATITELDARNATAPPRFEVKAPDGAPNVVIVLIDDIGFGASELLRRPDQHADAREDGRGRDCATTASTRPRSAARRAWRC